MLEQVRPEIYLATPDEPFFRNVVQRDLAETKKVRLSLQEEMKDALLVQSVLGHAQAKHKAFWEARAQFPQATLSDIVLAAGLNLQQIEQQRQDVIDDVQEWIEVAKQGKVDRLVLSGRPLLGVEFLREHVVNPEYVFRGMILGLMDNFEWRQNAAKEYCHTTIDDRELIIGGGTSVIVDVDKLIEWRPFAVEELANSEVTPAVWKEMKELGIFTDSSNPRAETVYVRKKKGLGTSDDAAFITAGELYKHAGEVNARSAFLGLFVIDGVDTYDKLVKHPLEGGYDEQIARQLRRDLPGLVSKQELYALIYHAAKNNVGEVVSSSHKKLIQYQEMTRPALPTLLHHLRFMEERKTAPFKVGFERQPSLDFYASVERRMSHLREEVLPNLYK
ncbi:hypothetical protein HY496_02265 [Candidatus Woesearchaeota archaeon]|nr:hypothetical protein [Candidatus Woesearchaeota archaeon]